MIHPQLNDMHEYLLNRGEFEETKPGIAAAAAAAELVLFWKEATDDSSASRMADVEEVINQLKKWRQTTIGQ